VSRLARFRDAKFGLFVHWGPYSVAGVEASWPVMLGPELMDRFVRAMRRLGMDEVDYGEGISSPDARHSLPAARHSLPAARPGLSWDEYRALAQRFDATAFDAGEWADLARAAGQRYVVLTSKHHDGFRMFASEGTDHTVMHTPLGRDVVAELATACEQEGVGFGTYFSCPDLADPGYRDQSRPPPDNFLGEPERPAWAGFLDRMEQQVRELCTRYGELWCMWWDLGFGDCYEPNRFHAIVRDLQPGAVMNDRLGADDADFVTPEQSLPRSIPRRSRPHAPPDLSLLFSVLRLDDWEAIVEQFAPVVREAIQGTDDPSLPEPGDDQPWEACMTFGGAWAWNPHLTRCKTGADIVRDLVEVASRGGNLLMNVGPRPDGTIQPEFVSALRDVGRWLARHGDAIYGTTFGLVQGFDGLRTTTKGDRLFVHVLDPPVDGALDVPVATEVRSATLVADGAALAFDPVPGGVRVALPERALDPVVTVVELS
jgi:alpha-L-fucosidase